MTDAMLSALNKQLEREGYASFLYLSMASWLDHEGLSGCAKFMYRQSDEEHAHMMRIFNYILEMDCKAIVPQINQPPTSYDSVQAVFNDAYVHEQHVTASINDLVDLSIKENDHATNNFLQWYVEEQREEEALMRDIQDKIRLIGDGPQSLYFIDKELMLINEIQEKAAEKEAD
ncbi:MAG: ferritin [Saprospiraceae bacterium]|nr:ferritin [Saprospiraceae bacterium]